MADCEDPKSEVKQISGTGKLRVRNLLGGSDKQEGAVIMAAIPWGPCGECKCGLCAESYNELLAERNKTIPRLAAENERLRADMEELVAMKRRDDPVWDKMEAVAHGLEDIGTKIQNKRVTELEAENERLKRELGVEQTRTKAAEYVRDDQHEELRDTARWAGELQAERDRYRTALNEIEGYDIDWSKGTRENVNAMADIARRALTSTTPPPGAEPAREAWPDEPVCAACLCHCPNCARPAITTSSYLDQTLDQARDALGNALYPGLNGDAPKGTANTLWAFAMEAARRLAAAPPVALRPAREVAHSCLLRDGKDPADFLLMCHRKCCPLCDRVTAAIEADRTQRTGLDPATVEACAKALEKVPGFAWFTAEQAAARIRSLAAQSRGEKL